MVNFIIGTVFGIIVATVGFGPVIGFLDGVILNIQKTAIENTAPKLPPPD
jgi:hypothetical protein